MDYPFGVLPFGNTRRGRFVTPFKTLFKSPRLGLDDLDGLRSDVMATLGLGQFANRRFTSLNGRCN
jgi:hypothetical protein